MKLSFLFNGLSVLASTACVWQIFSMTGKYDAEHARISEILKEKETVLVEQKDLNKEHASRYNRERAKNQQLEEDKFEATMEESSQSKAKLESESLISELENQIKDTEQQIINLKLDLQSGQKDFEKFRAKDAQDANELPLLEAKKNDIISSTDKYRFEISEFSRELKNYDKVTNILKLHYSKVIDSLFDDKSSGNWLKKGDYLSVSSLTVDLDNGLIGLPVGKDDGVAIDKFFAIRNGGSDICKIIITHSEFNRSIASIVPLIGNPSKLPSLDKFELFLLGEIEKTEEEKEETRESLDTLNADL